MGIELYYLSLSAPCRSIALLAKELDIELDIKPVKLFEGEHLQPWFLALNPQHTIPTINDNGFVLSESRAILQYLADQYGKDDGLYPKDPKKRAIVDHRLNFDLGTLYPRFREFFYPVAFRGVPAPTEEATAKLEEALGWVDDFIEKSGGWVAGSTKTIADYSFVALLSNAPELSGPLKLDLSKYKNLTAWLAKCKAELKGYEEANGKGATAFGEFFAQKIAASAAARE